VRVARLSGEILWVKIAGVSGEIQGRCLMEGFLPLGPDLKCLEEMHFLEMTLET